jgi:hypothetical protein
MATARRLSLGDIESLAQLRDELALQAHLAKAEAKSLWTRLEEDWDKLQREIKHVRFTTNQSAQEVSTAAELLFSSLKDGYQKFKQSLPKSEKQ